MAERETALTVNGRECTFAAPSAALVDVLRDELGLTGPKLSCGQGFCGACTVLVDGAAASSCSVLVADLDGSDVTTVEGLADGDRLHPVQRAFAEQSGFQCGYCTPGMVMTTVALLAEHPDPTDAEIAAYFEGNLCRCTGYAAIAAAVRTAVRTAGEVRRAD
ncbi:(2Fe-2S)-binding protein [Jiangella mangrovi]|uniref:Carbon-monoxide dehydrogenase small subunit n=1 Tax=Jiangella mangrovi TaxID=1524084 RepID=A0A7W9LJJ9_9ACTN|nr:(2Fe-2S)-binding protein [Jiangella mangrovi]MBB5786133.1 carbon-monoxide dehydrogenase small subunit [Jiangella mangrovi]